jgi:hypothetical protein
MKLPAEERKQIENEMPSGASMKRSGLIWTTWTPCMLRMETRTS